MNTEQVKVFISKDKEFIVRSGRRVESLTSFTLHGTVEEPIVTTLWEVKGAYPIVKQKVGPDSVAEYPLVIHVHATVDKTHVVLDGQTLTHIGGLYIYFSTTTKKILRLVLRKVPPKEIQERLLSLGAELIVRGKEDEINNAVV